MKIQRKEMLFWSESLNEVMRGFSVKPSLEVVFGDLFNVLEIIDNLLLDFRKKTSERSNEEILDLEGVTKEHLQVLKIAMSETVKEIREWELPLRTSSTVSEAKIYLKNIESYIEQMG
jgi:hypothetical protein